jgi:hypothetical protein
MTPPHFYIFVIISPLKRTWPFTWTNLNSLHPRVICTKFDWIWPAGSGEDFKKFSVYFYSFAIISPWRRAIYFVWINLIPTPMDDLCQAWLKLAQWFWRRRFLNESTPFSHFCDYLPFEEDLAIYLNKLEFSSSKDNLYQVWLNLACWFWRRRYWKKFQCIFTLSQLSPLEEGLSTSFE